MAGGLKWRGTPAEGTKAMGSRRGSPESQQREGLVMVSFDWPKAGVAWESKVENVGNSPPRRERGLSWTVGALDTGFLLHAQSP